MRGAGTKLAGLSIDVDSVASHLEGYGLPRSPDEGTAYTAAVPRALDLLARADARATFFLVADEARRHPAQVARIVAEGHEVASHSMTHRLPFRGLDSQTRRAEIAGSRALLEALAGEEVAGFRAPSWDVDPELLEEVAAAGYEYDSSTYPSILLPFLRAAIVRRSVPGGRSSPRATWAAMAGPTRLHLRRVGTGCLAEVPMCTTPGFRLPYYHTIMFVAPQPLFRWIGWLARARLGPVWYQFHAVDFLSLDSDSIDPKIARHPGMTVPLQTKLRLAADAVAALGRGRAVVPLQELVHRFFGDAQRGAVAAGEGKR